MDPPFATGIGRGKGTSEEIIETLRSHQVPAGRISSIADIVADPQRRFSNELRIDIPRR